MFPLYEICIRSNCLLSFAYTTEAIVLYKGSRLYQGYLTKLLQKSLHEPIIINDIFSYLCPSAEIYRKLIVFKHYIDENIDEPLKAIKVIDFLCLFVFCSWINRHNSSWLLAYLSVIALKLPLNVTRI